MAAPAWQEWSGQDSAAAPCAGLWVVMTGFCPAQSWSRSGKASFTARATKIIQRMSL
jgi:hypothetical protein